MKTLVNLFFLVALCLLVLTGVNAQTFAVTSLANENATVINFSAVKKQHSLALTWSTSGEQSSSHFTIEHSADGLHFDSIGAVTALGRFHLPTSYNFVDLKPKANFQYYRVLIVDLDGQIHVGKTLKVEESSGQVASGSFEEKMTAKSSPAGNSSSVSFSGK